MLRRPWEVSRITSGATPISLPILRRVSHPVLCIVHACMYSRFPMLDHCFRGVNNGAIHVEQEPIKGEFLWRLDVLWCRSHDVSVRV